MWTAWWAEEGELVVRTLESEQETVDTAASGHTLDVDLIRGRKSGSRG